MKLCYVANSRFPSERAHMTQIVQMCNAFAQNGHNVTLLVTDRKTSIIEDPETYFGTTFLFTVVRIQVPDIASMSVHIPKPLRPIIFLFQRVVFAVRSAMHIRKHQYTHIYGRDEWILWLLTRLTNVPIVWESHEAKFSKVVRMLIARVGKIVVISEGIQHFYVTHGVSNHSIFVAHDAVDERFFAPHCTQLTARKNLGIAPQKPAVFYIGGLDAWKGAETFFEAARNQNIFEAYVIGGYGDLLEHMKRKYPHVHFLGSRPYRELHTHQQAADILIIPNTARNLLSAEYTSPLKLFAHMTSKKPIIASNIKSITNILTHQHAYFSPADSPASLLRTIQEVVDNPEQASKKAIATYELSKQYTWCSRAEHIIQYITSESREPSIG